MRSSIVITSRDLAAFFRTLRGYLLLAGALLLWGFYFFTVVGRYNFIVARAGSMQVDSTIQSPTLQQFVIQPYMELLLVSFAILIPLLAMRTLPEERDGGTFELLRTSPIGTGSLVLGKFFTLTAILTLFTVLSGSLLGSLFFFGTPDIGKCLTGLLGLWFAGVAMSGVSLFIAARSHQPAMSALGGALTLTLLLLLHTPALLLPGPNRSIIEMFSLYRQALPFFDGYLPLHGVTYFLLLTLMGLFLTARALDAEGRVLGAPALSTNSHGGAAPERWRLLRHGGVIIGIAGLLLVVVGQGFLRTIGFLQLSVGALTLIATLWRARPPLREIAQPLRLMIRLAIVILLFVASGQSRAFLDLSSLRTQPLSAYTREALARLSIPIHIRYVATGNPVEDLRSELFLRQYVDAAPNLVEVETVYPTDYPDLEREFGIAAGERLQITKLPADVTVTTARRAELHELSEARITGALQTLTTPHRPKVYLIEGGGGPRTADTGGGGLSSAIAALLNEGVEFGVVTDDGTGIPEDAAAVLLIGPRTPLTVTMYESLRQYLKGRGTLFLAIDPVSAHPFLDLLAEFGLQGSDRIIIDREQLTFSEGRAGLQPLVRLRGDHPVVNRLGGVEALLMNGVTPIGLGTELATDAPTGQGLLYVGPGAVLADDPIGVLSGARSLSKYRSEVGSTTPIPVAAVATREDGSPRIVAVGDSDWLLNSALPYYSNRSFLLNSVHWLLGNSWALAERDRTELSSTVALSDDDLKLAMALMVLSAQLLLLMGLVAVYRRRVGEQCS